MNLPNAVVHFEMPYSDADRVVKFYTQAFGWKMNALGEKMSNYVLAATTDSDDNGPKNPGAINGGFFPTMPGVGTTVVINVDNIDEALEKVLAAGGKTLSEKMEIPGIGTYAAIEDSEGNRVGVLQPLPMNG